MKLPKSPWQNRKGLQQVIAALGGNEGMTRYVGGAVRDTLLELPVTDVDLATSLRPEEVTAHLEAADIKVIPTGIEHGTVTAVAKGDVVEITTLRRDVSTDGRRATVAFSDDWKEDAARRDFTINALSANPDTLEISDYFSGLKDLEARHIRFIGTAKERIAEDYLRIMRYFRFLARFGEKQLDDEAILASTAAAPKIATLSRERVADELLKLLTTNDPRFAVGAMLKNGIFDKIIADMDNDAQGRLDKLITREIAHDVSPDALRRLAAVIPASKGIAVDIATDLKLSKKMRRALGERAEPQINPAPDTIRALAFYDGKTSARDAALLHGADSDLKETLARLVGWDVPQLPLSGGDLISFGLKPGPVVTKTLAAVEREWIAQGFPDERKTRNIAEKIVAGLAG